jgi:O-antigen biosynthesis protein
MFRRTIDLMAVSRARGSHTVSEAASAQSVHCIVVDTRGANICGWYRAKIIAPEVCLQRVSIEAIDRTGARISAFESVTSNKLFKGNVFLGPSVVSLRLRLDCGGPSDDAMSAMLRPISLIEFIWHSLRRGFLQRPLIFLKYFFRPQESFVITYNFPRPARFAGQNDLYDWWIAEREHAVVDRIVARPHAQTFERPSISILMSVCDPQPIYLRKAIDSVLRQTAPNWELCITDDASMNHEVRDILSGATSVDRRIKLQMRERKGGLSAATNNSLAQASAPFALCLDHDDMLAAFAIEAVSTFVGDRPDARLVYSDEDKIDQNEKRFLPYFKPEFSRELLYSYNYINHLTAYHCDTLRKIGGWRGELDGAQDYDINLRTVEVIDERRIGHIPAILYHRRGIWGSAAIDLGFKPDSLDAGKRALEQHLARRSVRARVGMAANNLFRVRYDLPEPQPKVSIIIPFRDQAKLLRQCVSSIMDKTTYGNYDIILVDNGSAESVTTDLLAHYGRIERIRVLQHPGEFNYSLLNNRAAEYSRSDYVCFLNNDTVVITPDWLEDMVGYASQSGVGCVGAKLYYANGAVQHAGIVLGLGDVSGHVFLNRSRDEPGYFGRLLVASNYSAVTGACLLVRRSIFMDVGGFDERELPVTFNDIDFCIKVRSSGYRNVVTPYAELFHFESASRGHDDDAPEKALRLKGEVQVMRKRHGVLLERDPCYSPHLTLTRDDFSISLDRSSDCNGDFVLL